MLFKSTKDWKQCFSPEDEEKLNEVLKKAAKHRCAYKLAEDVKVAQLWAAVLELYKHDLLLQKRIEELEELINLLYKFMKERHEVRDELLKKLEREQFLDP